MKGALTINKSRKYQLTINNPQEHGFTHETIKQILSTLSNIAYWCMCDEIGESKTYHTHLYFFSPNAILFSTVKQRFYGAHIELAKGTHAENKNYITKSGKWSEDLKHETNLPDTFEESGELPAERLHKVSLSENIFEMLENGATNAEIIRQYPAAFNKLKDVDLARQTLLEDELGNKWRKLYVTYIWGETGTGKTRSIMEKYGYKNVFRVTNYKNPFDNYKGQDVIMFEEFRSSLPITDMLKYLDGYPVLLPCRYNDKVACFTKVFIVSNISLDEQYPNIQIDEKETYNAFKRRIHECYEFLDSSTYVPF